MLRLSIKKPQLKAAILCIIHGALGLFCLGSLFASLTNSCRSLFYSYFFIYSAGGFTQTVLEYKIPTMDLFDERNRKRIKHIIIVLLFPVALQVFLAVMWWAKWTYNPLYCMFVVELGLSPLFGILVTLHAFIGFILYVAVGHAYIKRKYFLITIGGPQNQIRRNENGQVIVVNIPNAFAHQANNSNYQQFNDGHQYVPQSPHIKQEIYNPTDVQQTECPICLTLFTKEDTVNKISCNHIFHIDCLKEWIDSQAGVVTCPVCRASVN